MIQRAQQQTVCGRLVIVVPGIAMHVVAMNGIKVSGSVVVSCHSDRVCGNRARCPV